MVTGLVSSAQEKWGPVLGVLHHSRSSTKACPGSGEASGVTAPSAEAPLFCRLANLLWASLDPEQALSGLYLKENV